MRIEGFRAGLRCHDVHAGLRNVDPNAGSLAPLSDTRAVGMAASLATLIRGQDVVANAEALKSIVAEQLDISPYAFPTVIETLERAGFVDQVQRKGTRIVSFTETVPFHQTLYDQLGVSWKEREPSQLEEEMIALVDRLATSPVAAEQLEEELGLDRSDIPHLLDVGKSADLVKTISMIDGELLYSPFYGFENPDVLAELLTDHGPGRIAEELAAVRRYQGLPLDSAAYPALADAISRGFVLAPSVLTPEKVEQPFAALPYLVDRDLLTVRKQILEKALAVLACVRCGEHFGGATSTRTPERVLAALLDPNRDYTLSPHSSHRRQYKLLHRMQIVNFIPPGNWVSPRLIKTEDNLAAVSLARDLVMYGEPMENRTGDDEARALLTLDSVYQAPIQTVYRRRERRTISDREYQELMDKAMGRAPL